MTLDQLTEMTIGICIKVHRVLGAGLFESVYEEVVCYELTKQGLPFRKQQAIPVIYDDIQMDVGFRADIIVNDQLLLEIKSIESIHPVHKKQVLTYLSLANIKIGLLVNFNTELLKDGITRLYNKNFDCKTFS
jgi:GxxExxY protein